MHVILVPGLWLVGSSWDQVVPALEAAGHQVHALTPPGMGSRRLDRSAITLADHVADLVDLVDALSSQDGSEDGSEDGFQEGGKIALVAHSAGGALAHACVDARPDRVARVVYVAGEPRAEGHSAGDWPAERGEVPLPDWSQFPPEMLTDLDESMRETMRARSIPSPEGVVRDPQKLGDDRRHDVPVTMVVCEHRSEDYRRLVDEGEPLAAELSRIKDVTWVDLPTGHWPQVTRPAELGAVLVAALDG